MGSRAHGTGLRAPGVQRLFGGPCARGLGSVGTGWAEISRFRGGNWGFFGENCGDLGDVSWGKDGGMLDPLETKQIHGSNPTKPHQTNKSQKKLGLFLVGNFRNWGRIHKIRLENKMGGSNFVRNHGS